MVLTSEDRKVVWKNTSFSSYKPYYMKTFGCICISQNSRIALVRGARTGIWSFPKGHLNRSESQLSCALRELEEETGIKIREETPSIGYRKLANGGYFIFEMCEEPTLMPRDSVEISETGWFSLDEIRSMNVNVDVSRFCSLL